MSNFARSITRFLESTSTPASAIERTAGLANGTITKIRAGSLPSVDKLEDLLHALNNDTASRDALRAYLIDHTPEDYRMRVQIQITPAAPPVITETTPAAFDPTTPDALDRAIEILRARGHDPRIRKMILSLVDIIT